MGLLAMAGMVSGLGEGIRETGKTAQAGYIQSALQDNYNAFQLKKQQEQQAYDTTRVDREQSGANERQRLQGQAAIDAATIAHPDRRNEEAVSNALKALQGMSEQWHKQMDAKALFNIQPTQDELDRITKIETMRDTILGHTGNTAQQIMDLSHFNEAKVPPSITDPYGGGKNEKKPDGKNLDKPDKPDNFNPLTIVGKALGLEGKNPQDLLFPFSANSALPTPETVLTDKALPPETWESELERLKKSGELKVKLVPQNPPPAPIVPSNATPTVVNPSLKEGLLNIVPKSEPQPAAVPHITLSRTLEKRFQQQYPDLANQYGWEKNPDDNKGFDARNLWNIQRLDELAAADPNSLPTPTLKGKDSPEGPANPSASISGNDPVASASASPLAPWVGAAKRLGEPTENENTQAADLRRFEGLKLKPYQDRNGWWAIGNGTQLDKNLSAAERGKLSITEEDAKAYAIMDLRRQRAELASYGWFNALNTEKQNGIAQLAYTMGVDGVLKFPKMIKALEAGDDAKVAAEIRNSDWYKQVKPTRGEFVIRQLQGN